MDLTKEEDLGGVGMAMNVKNNTSQMIQLYGRDIMLNGQPNNELVFDYCGEVAAGEREVCGLILSKADIEGRNTISGVIEINDEANNTLFETSKFSIDVDFDQGTIRAEIFAK